MSGLGVYGLHVSFRVLGSGSAVPICCLVFSEIVFGALIYGFYFCLGSVNMRLV